MSRTDIRSYHVTNSIANSITYCITDRNAY
jgi:hypothetical protein